MFLKWRIFLVVAVCLTWKVQKFSCEAISDLFKNTNEFETIERLLEEEINNLYYSRDWVEDKDDDLINLEGVEHIEQLNSSIIDLFSTPRNHKNPTEKLQFQSKLKNELSSFGYDVTEQVFRVRYLDEDEKLQYELGRNLIATLNGKYSLEGKQIQRILLKKIMNLRSNKIDKKIFNETITDHDLVVFEQNLISKQKDKLVIIGAHYDTLDKVNGIEDNASGCMALLKLAKLLKNYKLKFNYTIIFAFLDFEEIDALGSMSFVNHFLIPNYLKNQNSTFYAAIILDMLFNINQQQKIEQLEKQKTSPRNVYQDVVLNNSISIWYRKQTDSLLANQLVNSFNLKKDYEISLLPVLVNLNESTKNRFYFRGDHYSFWSLPSNSTYELPTVLITNMTPWRGNHKLDCYHKKCDDSRQLTRDNLVFLNKLIYLLRDALINLE